MKYVTITRKIELKPIYSYDSETASEEEIKKIKKKVWDKIRDADYWTTKIANRVVTECWSIWSKAGKRDFKLIQPYKVFSEIMCVEFPELKKLKISAIAGGTCRMASKKVYDEYYDIVNGNKSLPSFKSGLPMSIARARVSDTKGNRKYLSTLLDDKNLDYSLSTSIGKMKLFFGRDKSNNKSIIDKCRSGEYDLIDSNIQYNKKRNKIFLLASIKIPKEVKNLDKDKYLGVDLGVSKPIVASVYNSKMFLNKNKEFVPKDSIIIGDISEFLKERTKMQAQRRNLQKSLISSRSGHGRKRKLIGIDNSLKKERNWVRTKNHTYSKQLIDFALKQGCRNIVIEDLSGFNDDEKNQKFIGRNWSYFELQTMIKNKAKKYDIVVHEVNPKNTSKGCSNCGYVHDENRKTQTNFECVSCGHKMNADLNASQNIVKKHLKVFDFSKKID